MIERVIEGSVRNRFVVLLGAAAGSRWLGKLRSNTIRLIFVVVLLWVAVQMLREGLRG